MDADAEVIIIGGGIAGASLGAHLAATRRTAIIEAESHCGYHSTGRSAAFFLESYGGPEVAKLTRASGSFLAHPPAEFSNDGFLRRRGAIHVSSGGWPAVPDGVESRRLDRDELTSRIPGLRPQWQQGLFEPGCADIDVARLHEAYLRQFRRRGGAVLTDSRLVSAVRSGARWTAILDDGRALTAPILVNAAGAWADVVARACGVAPIGFAPKRRTMVQLRVGRTGLHDLPLINDWQGSFYFKGEGDDIVWLSPHDEITSDPCDAAPEDIDVAVAIDRFERVVDWPVETVERRWAGLRTFAPDRLPVYGFDPTTEDFFWCAGQGGFGIQTAPAASLMAASLLLGTTLGEAMSQIDPAQFAAARFR